MTRVKFVKKIAEKLQNIFSAAAFAEAGEFECAREIAQEQGERLAERKETLRRELKARNTDRLSAN